MRDSFIRIEINDGEIQDIMNELSAAQETIYKCYDRLIDLGVIVVSKKEAASGN